MSHTLIQCGIFKLSIHDSRIRSAAPPNLHRRLMKLGAISTPSNGSIINATCRKACDKNLKEGGQYSTYEKFKNSFESIIIESTCGMAWRSHKRRCKVVKISSFVLLYFYQQHDKQTKSHAMHSACCSKTSEDGMEIPTQAGIMKLSRCSSSFTERQGRIYG